MDNDQRSSEPFWRRLLQRFSIGKEEYEQLQNEHAPQPTLNVRFTDSRTIILSGLIVVALFFGFGGLWITFAEITGAIIANGEIRVDTERKTVQHLEGGIVREILVRNGDQVEAGQPLILLDGIQIASVADHTLLQMASARVIEARLTAELELSSQPDWTKIDVPVSAEDLAQLAASEQKVFNSGRQALENQIALLNKQIDQLHEQVGSIDDRFEAELLATEALKEELDAKLVLYKDQFIDKTTILALRRVLADRQGVQAQLRGQKAELRERIAEFQLRIHGIESEYRQKAVNELSKIKQEIFALQQKLLPLQDARRRQVVTAPVTGEVVAMQIHSEGGVIRPGEPILDIVPKDSPLIVECHIRVADVADVYNGQIADVQLLAFPARTPKIAGKVVYVSADRILRNTPYGEQPSYVTHVELDKQELAENDLNLTAGMPAAVFIRTKPRTILEYALEPLKENFDRALREK